MRFRQWFEYSTTFEELPAELNQLRHIYWYFRDNAKKSGDEKEIHKYIHKFLKNRVPFLDSYKDKTGNFVNATGTDDHSWIIDGINHLKHWNEPFEGVSGSILEKLKNAKLMTLGKVITAMDNNALPLRPIEVDLVRKALLPQMLLIRPALGARRKQEIPDIRFQPGMPPEDPHFGD